jgi:hypothetical protein
MLLVSKLDHCLADLLYRWRAGELAMEIAAIVSNHPAETYARLDFERITFHYLPVSSVTKLEQEIALWKLIEETHTELVVLARYVQVLSDGLVAKLRGSGQERPGHRAAGTGSRGERVSGRPRISKRQTIIGPSSRSAVTKCEAGRRAYFTHRYDQDSGLRHVPSRSLQSLRALPTRRAWR